MKIPYNKIKRARILLLNEPYKLEILDSIKTEPITVYHIGNEWWDLCAGLFMYFYLVFPLYSILFLFDFLFYLN
jgi:threonyl-tRNA synthetase